MEGGDAPAQLPPPSEACVLQQDNTVTWLGEATSPRAPARCPGLGQGPRGSSAGPCSPSSLCLEPCFCRHLSARPPQTLPVSIKGLLISEAPPVVNSGLSSPQHRHFPKPSL